MTINGFIQDHYSNIQEFLPEFSKGTILKWGTIMWSRTSVDGPTDCGWFIVYFKTPINIKSYKLKVGNDVFPVKWYISVSNDKVTWNNISYINEPLCSKNNWAKQSSDKYFCKITEEKDYTVNHSGYINYVKFNLIENSFYCGPEWADLIALSGFEIRARSNKKEINTCQQCAGKLSSFLTALYIALVYS